MLLGQSMVSFSVIVRAIQGERIWIYRLLGTEGFCLGLYVLGNFGLVKNINKEIHFCKGLFLIPFSVLFVGVWLFYYSMVSNSRF